MSKVFLSLTTSPQRIKHLPKLLRSLDLKHFDKVYINLPYIFGRNKTKYEIQFAKHWLVT